MPDSKHPYITANLRPFIEHYDCYKGYLKEAIISSNSKGEVGRIAKAAGCQISYVSQVLHGRSHFNADQLIGVATYFNLEDEETSYLIELMNLAKSSAKKTKTHFQTRLSSLAEKISDRHLAMPRQGAKKEEVQLTLHSDITTQLVLTSLQIPALRTIKKLSAHLGLSQTRIQNILARLETLELVKCEAKTWISKETYVPPESSSALSIVQRVQWAQKNSLQTKGLHYFTPLAVSKSHWGLLKETLLNLIQVEDPKNEKEKIIYLGLELYEIDDAEAD